MSTVEDKNTVSGQVVLPDVELAGKTADFIIQVEDVSRADAPSAVVGEQRVSRVPLQAGMVFPFSIAIPAKNIIPNHSYAVKVHVDISGSGKIEKADLITMQSYPVLTQGYGNEVKVSVRQV
jgi:putative lipoprotein